MAPVSGEAEYMTQALLKGLHIAESKEGGKERDGGLLEKPFTDQEIIAMVLNLYLGKAEVRKAFDAMHSYFL